METLFQALLLPVIDGTFRPPFIPIQCLLSCPVVSNQYLETVLDRSKSLLWLMFVPKCLDLRQIPSTNESIAWLLEDRDRIPMARWRSCNTVSSII